MSPVPTPPVRPPDAPAAREGAGRRVRVALLLALVVAVVAHVRGAGEHPNNQDRELDLLLARRIVAEGVWTDGCRSPLFPLCLAPVAGADAGFAQRARWVGLATGALAFAVVFLVLARLASERTALVAALALGPEWTFQVSRLRGEPIAAALVVVCAACLATRRGAAHPLRAAFLAGAFAGASHLAKGSGPLTLLAASAVVVVQDRRRAMAPVALLVAGFVLVAAPLLVDTARRFGSPFFNANTAHVMWEEAGEDQQWRWSTATPASWWAAHGLAGTLERLGRGLLVVTHGPVLWATLAAAAALRWARRRGGATTVPDGAAAFVGVTAAFVVAWLPPFAWYVPIANGRRYLFPVVAAAVPALVVVLEAALRARAARAAAAVDAVGARLLAVLASPVALVAAVVALVAADVVESRSPPRPGPRVPFDEATLAVASRLRALPEGTRVLAGPSATVPSPWLVHPAATYVHLPSGLPPAEAEAWVRGHADVVLWSRGLATRRPQPFASWADGAPPSWAVPASPADATGPLRLYRVVP